MTPRGFAAAAGVEWSKTVSQRKTQLTIAACAISPFAFAATMLIQSSLPEDTLFGRAAKDSGFAIPLVVLGFAGLWAFPVIASLTAGDIFAAEDRFGTWTTVLTRSRSRHEIFAGKVAVALLFSAAAIGILGVSSLAAGVIVIGVNPLISLSGMALPPLEAVIRVAGAWMSVLPPVLGFSAAAILVSIATRSSVAGIGVPIAAGLGMQLYALVDGPEFARWLLISSAFGGWHGLLSEPPYYRPAFYGSLVSAVYFLVCLASAYRLFERRDVQNP